MSAIRVITAADVPQAMRLKEAAGWNQTETDWHNVMRLAPDGCFGIDCDGVLAATSTAVSFGRELAWIGMVLTLPDFRGRGFARRLMEHAIEYLEARGVEWIKLDATDMGRPLYLKLGFEDEAIVERWGGAGQLPERRHDTQEERQDWRLDREAFGADRSELLGMLARMESACRGEAYAMGRPGSKAAYFGPCVSREADAVRELLRWFLSRHANENVYWDILIENREAVAIAQEFQFRPLRGLVRMARRGRRDAGLFAHNDSRVYAIAGFEYG
jgi:GNAT superfamily N-acetyltransferase